MKKILVVLIVITSVLGFSQTKEKKELSQTSYTIARIKIAEAKIFHDLVAEIPETLAYINYEISYKSANGIKVQTGSGNKLSTALMKEISKAPLGSTIYLDLKIKEKDIVMSKKYDLLIKE